MFDDLSFKQAEDMLRRHGNNGVYLVSHFHDPESFGVSIRLRYFIRTFLLLLVYTPPHLRLCREGEEVVYKHYPVCIAGQQLYADGVVSRAIFCAVSVYLCTTVRRLLH